MKRMILIFFLFFGEVALASGTGTTFIGNGGGGIVIDKVVYLSDLYLGGKELYQYPFIGTTATNYYDIFTGRLDTSVDLPVDLIVRKLNDLDGFWNGFGAIIGESILSHQWIFADAPLKVTCDRLDDIFTDLQLVQIANRHFKEVRIDRALWRQMPEAHRVALVIHEAVYNLMRGTERENSCNNRFSAEMTQRIVRYVFQENILGFKKLKPEMIEALNISSGIMECAHLGKHYLHGYRVLVGKPREGSGYLVYRDGGANILDRIPQSVDKFCAKLNDKKLPRGTLISVKALRNSFRKIPSGAGEQFVEQGDLLEFVSIWSGTNQCRLWFNDLLSSWYSDQDYSSLVYFPHRCSSLTSISPGT